MGLIARLWKVGEDLIAVKSFLLYFKETLNELYNQDNPCPCIIFLYGHYRRFTALDLILTARIEGKQLLSLWRSQVVHVIHLNIKL